MSVKLAIFIIFKVYYAYYYYYYYCNRIKTHYCNAHKGVHNNTSTIQRNTLYNSTLSLMGRHLPRMDMLTSAPLSNSNLTHSMCPFSKAFITAVSPLCNDKCISSWEYHQWQIHTTHQSDREYTRTSTTHSSTTHSTNTKKAPLGGTYSAPSYPMMSYTANILPPIPKKQTPSLHQILYARTRTVDMYKDPTVQPQNKRHTVTKPCRCTVPHPQNVI